MKKKIAIFASGGGSNAREIMRYFEHHTQIEVALLVSNKAEAGVLDIADSYAIPTLLISKKGFYESNEILESLTDYSIDFIVLAGFLWLIPSYLVTAYPNQIVNIHPALLPKYGGKGMYGHHVHEAVKAANESVSGMTIHYVNAHYDEGNIIYQATCALDAADSVGEIAAKVLALEHQYFSKVIESTLLD